MYLIAICDDDALQAKETDQLLEAYSAQNPDFLYKTHYFNTVESLLSATEDGVLFDALFLDIYLDGMSGIAGALHLRERNYDFPIVFCSSSKEHSFDAFSVNAAQYLVKPLTVAQFFPTMDKVRKITAAHSNSHVSLRIENGIQKLSVRKIVYVETCGNYQHLHMENRQELIARVTATQLFDTLSVHPRFTQVGKSYIVNMDFIDNLSVREIVLTTGMCIHLPRGSFSIFKNTYFQFLLHEDF